MVGSCHKCCNRRRQLSPLLISKEVTMATEPKSCKPPLGPPHLIGKTTKYKLRFLKFCLNYLWPCYHYFFFLWISLPQIIKQHGNHLKASAAIVRLRMYSVLTLLPPKSYEGIHVLYVYKTYFIFSDLLLFPKVRMR